MPELWFYHSGIHFLIIILIQLCRKVPIQKVQITTRECLLRLGVPRVFVLFCVLVCVWVIFAMVPLNLTCLQCLQHSFFEHLFNLLR